MLRVSRMRSLLTLTPALSSNSTAAAPRSLYSDCRSSILLRTTNKIKPHKTPILVPSLSATNSLANCSKPSISSQGRGLCTEGGDSGEIHLIVGPMFAGKTTTLLKRMKLESSNGRLDKHPFVRFQLFVN